MILGPSGQNIYPEEIEQRLNNMPYVSESLIVDKDNKLVALIYPDIESATSQGISMPELEKMMSDNIMQLNKELPAYSQISGSKIYHEEFEKTPKRSIKRYLYTNS
jgi:long-chain acyl-CoA synthetase